MPRFLVEVPHAGTKEACQRAIDTFNRTGSHFLTHADWGCKDNEHKAWLIVDVGSKQEARNVVPQDYRGDAKVTMLTQFNQQTMDAGKKQHS